MPTTEWNQEKTFLSIGTTVPIGNNDLSKMDKVYDLRIGKMNKYDRLGWNSSLTYATTTNQWTVSGDYYALAGGVNYQIYDKLYLLGELGFAKTNGHTGGFQIDDGKAVSWNAGIIYQTSFGFNGTMTFRDHTRGQLFQNPSGVLLSIGYSY
ncbi:hypothetical protein H4F17_07365 [Vibrio cholerae]